MRSSFAILKEVNDLCRVGYNVSNKPSYLHIILTIYSIPCGYRPEG